MSFQNLTINVKCQLNAVNLKSQLNVVNLKCQLNTLNVKCQLNAYTECILINTQRIQKYPSCKHCH